MKAHAFEHIICLRGLTYGEDENGRLTERTVMTFQSGDGSLNIHCRSVEDARLIAQVAVEVASYMELREQGRTP